MHGLPGRLSAGIYCNPKSIPDPGCGSLNVIETSWMWFTFMTVELAMTGRQGMDNKKLSAPKKTGKNAIGKSAGLSEGDS